MKDDSFAFLREEVECFAHVIVLGRYESYWKPVIFSNMRATILAISSINCMISAHMIAKQMCKLQYVGNFAMRMEFSVDVIAEATAKKQIRTDRVEFASLAIVLLPWKWRRIFFFQNFRYIFINSFQLCLIFILSHAENSLCIYRNALAKVIVARNASIIFN